MAFPQTVDPTRHASSTNQQNHDVPMPSFVAAGDLLIALISLDALNPFTGIPSGWSNLGSGAGHGHAFAKVADGSEGGTTPRWQTTSALGWSSHVYRITDWFGSLSGVEAAMATGASGDPNPPSLTPSWGAADTLWLAYAGQQGTATISVGPTGFSTPIVDSDTSSAAKETSMSCRRQINAASQDPSIFDSSISDDWRAFTIAIRPGTTFAPRIDLISQASTRPAAEWLAGFSSLPQPPTPAGGRDLVRFIR